ncbi:MAG: sigma-70 family RNA polymerase sigma factor [Myxococcota bacterium]
MDDVAELLAHLSRHRGGAGPEALLVAVRPHLVRLVRRHRGVDADEVVQQALIRVWRGAARCRAETPGQLARWLRTLVRRALLDHVRRREIGVPEPAPAVTPEGLAARAEQQARLDEVIAAAHQLVPAALPHRHRAWARRHRVAATPAGIRRDVAVALAVRREEQPVAQVAAAHGLTRAAAAQAAARGVAALTLAARLLDDVAGRIRDGIRIDAGDPGPSPALPPMLRGQRRDGPPH